MKQISCRWLVGRQEEETRHACCLLTEEGSKIQVYFSRHQAVAGTCPEQLPHARYRCLLLLTLDNHGQPAALTPAHQAGRAATPYMGDGDTVVAAAP